MGGIGVGAEHCFNVLSGGRGKLNIQRSLDAIQSGGSYYLNFKQNYCKLVTFFIREGTDMEFLSFNCGEW